MSTHIIDQIAAIKVPCPNPKGEEMYIVAFEGGDNNVINCDTNRRARDWYPVALGSYWRCMSRVVTIASDMEGGMARLYGERHTKPENFIRRVRGVVDRAPSFDQAKFYVSSAVIRMTNEEREKYNYAHERLVRALGEPIPTQDGCEFVFATRKSDDLWTLADLWSESAPSPFVFYNRLSVCGRFN